MTYPQSITIRALEQDPFPIYARLRAGIWPHDRPRRVAGNVCALPNMTLTAAPAFKGWEFRAATALQIRASYGRRLGPRSWPQQPETLY